MKIDSLLGHKKIVLTFKIAFKHEKDDFLSAPCLKLGETLIQEHSNFFFFFFQQLFTVMVFLIFDHCSLELHNKPNI